MKMDALKTIQEQREEFYTLPTSEKLMGNRERRVASLLRVGYITPDEANTYREQLTELPTDRKGLVVAYFLLGIDSYLDATPSLNEAERIKEIVASFRIGERGLLKNGKTLGEGFTPEERTRWTEELSRAQIEANITKAETFVDAKRSRIRAQLLKIITLELATTLIADFELKEGQLDSIPYLREELQERGYRAKAKSLNEADKAAMEGAASHYLDLLELAFLNGEGLLRNEEYKEYLSEDESEWIKELIYRDVYDEALTEFGATYILLDNATANFYTDGTAKEAIDFLKRYFTTIAKEQFSDSLKGTKFNYLIEEGEQC